jgi:protein subunit release factor A
MTTDKAVASTHITDGEEVTIDVQGVRSQKNNKRSTKKN